MTKTVAILGASNNPNRYSYLAFKMLQEYGHVPIPVSPKMKELEGIPVFSELGQIQDPIDTLTIYVGPERSKDLFDQISKLKPRRVIFNPGSENPGLEAALTKAGIQVLEACTLVLLRENKF